MTVAGSYTFNPTIGAMLTDALYHCGLIGEDETPTNAQFQKALNAANYLAKEWEANAEYHVWTEEEAILFLQPGQYRYSLGPPTTDHACPAFGWTQGALTATALAGASALAVASIAGIASGDTIGVFLDSGFIFWTTVNGAPSGLTVNLAAPLPSQASNGALIADYPAGTDITRPLRIPRAASYRYSGASEIPMRRDARQQYMDLPNKQSVGSPIEFFYAPKMGTGELYIWQPVNVQTWAVRFTWYRPISDFLTPANTMDLPQEWASTLMWNIAAHMMPGVGTPPARAQMIATMAASKMDKLTGWDRESEDLQFSVATDGRGR